MARTRGSMKHPFRIRQQKGSKDATDAQIDAILGDDFGCKKKKPLRAPEVKPRRTGVALQLQQQKYLQRMQTDAVAHKELQSQEEQFVDPWADQDATVQPVEKTMYERGYVMSSTHSAYSYNPEKTILEKAQQAVAREYLTEQLAEVSAKLSQSRYVTYKDQRAVSMQAFEALAGNMTELPVDLEFQAAQDAARKEYEELEALRVQLESKPSEQLQIDFLVAQQQKIADKKATLEAELASLAAYFEQERQKLEAFITAHPRLNGDRIRAEAFNDSFLPILEEMGCIRKLLTVYGTKTTLFNDKVLDYPLLLEGDVAATLRQSKVRIPLEELFLKMKHNSQFDNQNPAIKFDKILRVKRVEKLARGAMEKYNSLSQ